LEAFRRGVESDWRGLRCFHVGFGYRFDRLEKPVRGYEGIVGSVECTGEEGVDARREVLTEEGGVLGVSQVNSFDVAAVRDSLGI
jgi:hypothetical protein